MEGGVPILGGAQARRAGLMRTPVTRELHEYWRHLKRERAAPDRAEIDPAAIRHMLPDTFILEVDANRGFPIRLCGPRVNAFWLTEQKGRPFLCWWRVEDQAEIIETIRQVVDAEIPIVARVRAAAQGDESSKANFELLLLPLRHFGKSHSRVLGSLVPLHSLHWLGGCLAGPLELVVAPTLEEEMDRPIKDRRNEAMNLAAP